MPETDPSILKDRILRLEGAVLRLLEQLKIGATFMSNGASKVLFFEEGKDSLGEYLMYSPPAIGDHITWGEDTLYIVVKRVCNVPDNMVRITVIKDNDI